MEAQNPTKCRLQINNLEELKAKLNKMAKLVEELEKAIEDINSTEFSYEIIEVKDEAP